MGAEANSQEMSVITIHEKCCVVPARPSEQKYCDLITFDLPFVTAQYNQKVIIYPSPRKEFASLVDSLKKSLSEALAYFYPLAGRLCMVDGILMVDCNGAGIDFIQASWNDVSVADLVKPDSSTEDIVPFNDTFNLDGFILPLLAVQVTSLKDGVAVGIALSHLLLDGYSTWQFMSSWTELCRGSKTISLPPSHDRALVRNIKTKLNITPPTTHTACNYKSHLRWKIFSFSTEIMEKIKSKANKNREGKPFSYFQSLGAHLWQAVTRARKFSPQEITVFTLFMDCRTRLDPPVPKNYMGNVIHNIYGAATVGGLLSNDLSFAANMLQQVIDSHGAKAIIEMNEKWEKNPKTFSPTDMGNNSLTIGSSPKFQVYDNDFGWGKPLKVRNGGNNRFDGLVYLYPGKDGGGSVDADITLLPHAMDMLESDAQFFLAN